MESLYDDIDYRSRLSRDTVEAAFEPSFAVFQAPITDALTASNLSLANLTSVILFGGNTRVPLVQAAVRFVVGDDERIAQNVNTDEAAVLGAAYYGAGLSRQFKMKSIDVKERSMADIRMGDDVIFEKGAKLGSRKTLSLPADEDRMWEFCQGS